MYALKTLDQKYLLLAQGTGQRNIFHIRPVIEHGITLPHAKRLKTSASRHTHMSVSALGVYSERNLSAMDFKWAVSPSRSSKA